MQIPASLRAGDTWSWLDSLSDYPAPTWTLTYSFFNASAAFSISAEALGADHFVNLAPQATAAYAAGRYNYTARAFDGTNRYEVGRGVFHVEPNPADQPLDGRSHARRMLDAIDAILEGRADAKTVDVVSADLNGRRLQYGPDGLTKLRQLYAAEVQAEERRTGREPGFVQMNFR